MTVGLRMRPTPLLLAALLSLSTLAAAQDQPVVDVFSNFETHDYQGWTLEGTAFGGAPLDIFKL